MLGYVQKGDVLDIPAPTGGVVASTFYKIGSLFGMASSTQNAGETVGLRRRGVFSYTAEGAGSGQAWAVGDDLYWDDTNKRFTKTSTSNTLQATATAVKVTTATVGQLALNK